MCVCVRAAAARARAAAAPSPTLFSQWDSHSLFFLGNGVCLLRSKDFHSGTVLFLFRASRNYKILLIYTAASPDAAPQSYLLCGPHLPEEKKKKKTFSANVTVVLRCVAVILSSDPVQKLNLEKNMEKTCMENHRTRRIALRSAKCAIPKYKTTSSLVDHICTLNDGFPFHSASPFHKKIPFSLQKSTKHIPKRKCSRRLKRSFNPQRTLAASRFLFLCQSPSAKLPPKFLPILTKKNTTRNAPKQKSKSCIACTPTN